MTAEQEVDVHGMVDQLTREHVNRQQYTVDRLGTSWTTYHQTRVPSLVRQLVAASPAASGAEAGTTAGSRPAARIEALDTIMLIDDEAGEWIDRLGGVIPADRVDPRTAQPVPGTGTALRLLRLHGLMAAAPCCRRLHGRRDAGAWCCERHHLEHDVRRWWYQARIITGWESPAYRPFNTCPVCEHRGGLRVNLAMASALCVECRAVWTSAEIGLLAEHIRGENAADEAPA